MWHWNIWNPINNQNILYYSWVSSVLSQFVISSLYWKKISCQDNKCNLLNAWGCFLSKDNKYFFCSSWFHVCKIAYSAEQGTELVSFSKFRIQSEKRLLVFVVSHCFFLVQKLSTLPLGSKVIRELIETWQKEKEVPSTTVPFREQSPLKLWYCARVQLCFL